MTTVFLDANVYFAAFFSDTGASALILEFANRGKITVFASKLVLREADRNLRKKSSPAKLKAFHRFLQQTKIKILPPPEEASLKPYEEIIHPKDVPVLGAAVASKADYLITLDRKHFLNPKVMDKLQKIKILTPADFIRDIVLKGKL